MAGLKEVRWLIFGFAAATMAAALLEPRAAAAQTAADRGRPQGLTFPGEPGRVSRSPLPQPDVDESDVPAVAGEGTADQENLDPNDPSRPRAGQRAVIVDGDHNYPAEPTAPVDGIVDTSEPEAPLDGADTSAIDMRSQEEINVFENPPAGFDPLLFQIEELSPVLDRRPERLFRREPYDPVGIRFGSFVYFPEAEADLAYFSNVFSSPTAQSDTAAELRTRSRLVSNWNVHALELNWGSLWSFYNDFDSEDDRAYNVEARGRLDIRRGSDLQAAAAYEHAQEDRSALDASTAGERPDIDTLRANAALTHRFNRLEAQLRASLTDTDIGDALDGFGNLNINDERDVVVDEEFLRLTYELKPSLAVFAETGINHRDYKTAPTSDGFLRNGDGQRYRIGLDFGDEGEILRGEISIGYGVQDHDTNPLHEVDGFLFDSNVTWRFSELTALRFTARTDISDTTAAGSSGVLTRQLGLEARHAFRRYFVGTAGISYSTNDYSDIELSEDTLRFNLDAEYFASRDIILFGRYQHTSFLSNEPDADWDSDEVRVGLKVRR